MLGIRSIPHKFKETCMVSNNNCSHSNTSSNKTKQTSSYNLIRNVYSISIVYNNKTKLFH